jgi:hypothetical protein
LPRLNFVLKNYVLVNMYVAIQKSEAPNFFKSRLFSSFIFTDNRTKLSFTSVWRTCFFAMEENPYASVAFIR